MSTIVEQPSDLKERSSVATRCYIPKRYVQAILASLAIFIIYWMRTSFFAMLLHIFSGRMQNRPTWADESIYLMDIAFTVGFIVAQVPGALLGIRFSPHRVLLLSMLATTFLHIGFPLCIHSNSTVLVVFVRLLQGISEGPIFPSCTGIWNAWAPPSERTRLFSIVLCGTYFGLVAGWPLNALFALHLDGQTCFFISGAMGLIWCLLWSSQTYENPARHPSISDEELTYLKENVSVDSKLRVPVKSIPWKAIFLSAPVWAICLANFNFVCSDYILKILPIIYVRFELNLDREHTILDFLLPIIIMGIIIPTSSFLADFLINRAHLSRTLVRKLYCSGAFALHAVAFLVVRYYKNVDSTVICFNVAHGLLGLSVVGFLVNCLDLSLCYASVVMALCQTFGGTAEIILSLTTAFSFGPGNDSSHLFDGIIAMSSLVALVYAICGSGNLQWWSKPEAERVQDGGDDKTRSSYYSYSDGGDDNELLVTDRHQSLNALVEMESRS